MVLKIIEKFHSVKEENLSHQNENWINLRIKFFFKFNISLSRAT